MALYDLTHPVESGMPVYPGSPPARVEPRSTVAEDGARVTDLELETHVGTHVDAPSHMLADGATLDAFDVSSFRFAAHLVDCTGTGPRAAITPETVPASLDPDVDMLVFHTGWDAHWGDERYRDHPYLAGETAARCAERGLSVALDCFSPDPTPPADGGGREVDGYPAHDALLGADCLVVENLTGLDALPERFRLSAFPLPIAGGDGSPVRAVAETDD